jgi:hypothetical protein
MSHSPSFTNPPDPVGTHMPGFDNAEPVSSLSYFGGLFPEGIHTYFGGLFPELHTGSTHPHMPSFNNGTTAHPHMPPFVNP